MKKKAYIAIAAVLCAGLLVTAACLRGGKPDDNIPDNLQMNDTQTPDENKPDDTQKPSDTQTPDNTTKPDDTQKPNDIQQPDDTLTPDEVKYVEVYRHPDNEKALQAYYDFLKNGGKARLAGESRELTLAETFEIMYAKAHDEFAFFDFGSDGIQELAIKTYHEYLVLFWENDRLYMDNVGVREMNAGYNGFETTGSNLSGNESRTGFVLKTFSAERGMDSLSLGYSIYNIDTGARSRYIYRELVDGEWVDRENTAVTEEAFQAYIAEFENAPELKWYPMTMTYDFDSFRGYSHIRIPEDQYWMPFPGEGAKPYTSPIPTFVELSELNTTALQNYYAFLTGEAVAYDIFHKKTILSSDLTNNGEAPVTSFSLVDYGGDGVLEVWLYRKNTDWVHEDIKNSAAVLFFENGNLYVDYLSRVGVSTQTYDGKLVRYNYSGSYIYEIVTVSAENGIHRQAIARRESALYHSKYYIVATYENGIYTDIPERECTIEAFEAFVSSIDHEFSRRTMTYTLSKIQEVFLSLK